MSPTRRGRNNLPKKPVTPIHQFVQAQLINQAGDNGEAMGGAGIEDSPLRKAPVVAEKRKQNPSSPASQNRKQKASVSVDSFPNNHELSTDLLTHFPSFFFFQFRQNVQNGTTLRWENGLLPGIRTRE
jgi:hypothetical protein